MIYTSNSRISEFLRCMRAGYYAYEADGQGWQRGGMNLALDTGIWCHRVLEGLLRGEDTATVILAARKGYLEEVRRRGLELGVLMDGSVPEEKFLERTSQEQAALIEAFGWCYARVRLPRLLGEYHIESFEREESTALAGDVTLQARCDAVLRRRSDNRLFVYNLKTASSPDSKKWQDDWLTNQQVMTETLAVERRLGERVYGVVIDGFNKGQRANVWWGDLKEIRGGGDKGEKWEAQRSRLLYGYKCKGNPPLSQTAYDWEGTTRKGWEKFAVWEEVFVGSENVSPIYYWCHWLPEEVITDQFVTLPPIMRTDEHVEAKVRQIVALERRIEEGAGIMKLDPQPDTLDAFFPQNEHSCIWSANGKRCEFYEMCWDHAADDPVSYGFVVREKNHPEGED